MKISLGRDVVLTEVPDELHNILVSELTFDNPKYLDAVRMGYYCRNIPKVISVIRDIRGTLALPKGYLLRLLEITKSLGIPVEISNHQKTNVFETQVDNNIILRDYQEEAIERLIINDTGVLKAPAGSGKTIMGLYLLPRLKEKMMWLTHTGPLARQAIERVNTFLPNITPGMIGASKWSIGNEITVAMVQTLTRNKDRVLSELSNEFGILILDESHHCPATTFTDVVRLFAAKRLYGLTATDKRKDRLEGIMYATLGPITSEVKRSFITENLITPTVIIKETGVFPGNDDSFSRLIRNLSYNESRNQQIVKDVLEEAYFGNICLVITERKAHADILYEKIKAKWDFTGIATGNFTKKQIKQQLEALEKREISVLVATSNLLGEGFDFAPLNRLFIGLPFRNEVRCEQIVGRVQRKAEGKTDACIYDYLDSHSLLRHQYKNKSKKGHGCRWNIYRRLKCNILDENISIE